MPDTKITALTAISTVDPAVDVLPIVDVSDTTMAASGTTKKITSNQILGAGGTATLASATITGDLTVDTSTLKVDSTNNRVGIGTASPTDSLHVYGSGNALIEGTAGLYARTNYKVGAKTWQVGYRSGTTQFEIQEDLVERYTIGNGGTPHTWYIGASTAMTLNSTGLGVGVTPSAWQSSVKAVQLGGAALSSFSTYVGFLTSNAYNDGSWKFVSAQGASRYEINANVHSWHVSTNSPSIGGAITFTQAMTLDASGNLLVGTTSAAGNAGGLKLSNVAGNLGQITFSNNSGSSDYVARFNWGSTPTLVGNITVSSGGTAFNTTSDYRLKKSVQPLIGGLARVNALKPSIYKWKSDGSDGEGFIAHELAEVVPFAVTGEKDDVNEDGSIKSQGIDMSRIVPVLVSAIQELSAEVNALKNA